MTIEIDENTPAGRRLAEMIRFRAAKVSKRPRHLHRSRMVEALKGEMHFAYIGMALAEMAAGTLTTSPADTSPTPPPSCPPEGTHMP